MQELVSIKDGKQTPTIETAGRAVSLRQYLARLSSFPPLPYLQSLVQSAVARVLTSSAPHSVKAMYSRTVEQFLPTSPLDVPPPSSGERIEWTSDEDGF